MGRFDSELETLHSSVAPLQATTVKFRRNFSMRSVHDILGIEVWTCETESRSLNWHMGSCNLWVYQLQTEQGSSILGSVPSLSPIQLNLVNKSLQNSWSHIWFFGTGMKPSELRLILSGDHSCSKESMQLSWASFNHHRSSRLAYAATSDVWTKIVDDQCILFL